DEGIFYINIDGVRRAYVHRYTFRVDTTDGQIKLQAPAAIRFMENDKLEPPRELITRPRIVPLRVEADTIWLDAGFQLSIHRTDRAAIVETIPRDATRERHAWLDGATMDGGVLVTTRVNDWVVPLDLRTLRRRYLLRATLMNNGT